MRNIELLNETILEEKEEIEFSRMLARETI